MTAEKPLPIPVGTSILVLVLLLAGFAMPGQAAGIDEDELPFQLVDDLAAALKAKADDLWAEKNEKGLHFQRGSYSRRFRKIEDGTYQTMFVKDTASDDRMNMRMMH